METFLYWFLNKYFDREIDYHKKREEGPEFEWYLTDNLYSYDTVRRMITDIQEKVALLAKDYDNPALDGLKKRYSMFYMGYRYKSILDSETDEYEIFYELDVDEEQFIKDNIGVAIDFYNRFCRLLQQMMEHNPDNEFISFMGP
ncbi:MAG: hypothetical protein II977_05515 [Oscillospiraceae bacterium]|nr:hypothetical protein [Oscillospiraceae bacterium]